MNFRRNIETGAPAMNFVGCQLKRARSDGLETLGSSSAGGHLDRRRAVGQVHRVGHRDEHFARPLKRSLPCGATFSQASSPACRRSWR